MKIIKLSLEVFMIISMVVGVLFILKGKEERTMENKRELFKYIDYEWRPNNCDDADITGDLLIVLKLAEKDNDNLYVNGLTYNKTDLEFYITFDRYFFPWFYNTYKRDLVPSIFTLDQYNECITIYEREDYYMLEVHKHACELFLIEKVYIDRYLRIKK